MISKATLQEIYFTLVLIIMAFCTFLSMPDIDARQTDAGTGMMPKAVLLSAVLLSLSILVYTTQLLKGPKIPVVIHLFILLFIWMMVGTALNTSRNFSIRIYNLCLSAIPMFSMMVSYSYTRMYGISLRLLYMQFLMMVLVALQYFNMFIIADGGHLIVSYFLMYMLPFVLLHPRNYIRYISIGLALLAVISSVKRGGSLSLALALVIYIFLKRKINGIEGSKMRSIVLSIISILVISVGVYYFLINTESVLVERIMNMQEDEGSGRLTVWAISWLMIMNEYNPLKIIVGHGFNRLVEDSPLFLSAHNDYIESIYDFGVIGFILLIFCVIAWVIYTVKMIKQNSEAAPSMLMMLIMFLILSMISHIVIYLWMMYFALNIGTFVGLTEREKQIRLMTNPQDDVIPLTDDKNADSQ